MSMHPGRRLREAMEVGPVAAPGAFNALVARAVADSGFDACYVSGGATANVAGYPDVGLITLTEMCRTILVPGEDYRRTARAVDLRHR